MLLENYPKNSTAFYLMGCIYEKKEEITQGIEYFNKAIEIDPNNVYALFSRGACYNMLGNYEQDIDDYSLALEKDSNRNGRKTMLRNIGKVLGLNNNENYNSNYANNNMSLSVNPFNDEKSNLDINNSSYLNLNNSKNIENLNLENEMNNYINYHLRDIISSSAGAIPNNLIFDKLNVNDSNSKANNSHFLNINKSMENNSSYNNNGNTNGNFNITNNGTISNNNHSNLRNTNLNFYNGKNETNNNSSSNNNNGILNNRLRGSNLDSNIFNNFKESARNKQNANNDFISPDDKLTNNFQGLNNKNINLNGLLSQNLNPTDIDNLIFSIKNNNLSKANSGILDNLKLLNNNKLPNSEFLQKNSDENSSYNSNNKLYNNNDSNIINSNNILNKGGNGISKLANKSLNTYPKNQSGTNLPHEMNTEIKANVKTSASILSKNSVDKRDKSKLLEKIFISYYLKQKF